MNYLFELGRNPKISIEEIKSVLGEANFKTTALTDKYLEIETGKDLKPTELVKRLGGTIKISEKIPSEGKAKDNIADFLDKTQQTGKIQFSVNEKTLLKDIKNKLKEKGRSVRFVEIKNTASIGYNKLVQKNGDIVWFKKNIFVTRAIQPFEEMGERDMGRPGVNTKSGVLPPKLAKIMINLSGAKENDVILDPFCGSGTIATEALTMNFKNFIASDADETAVKDTEKNIDWVCQKYKNCKGLNYKTTVSKAENIHQKIKTPIDTIVSEPYMGKPLRGTEQEEFIEKQADYLKRMYVNCFKSFKQVIKKNGVIIFIFPSFKTKNGWIKTEPLKELEQMGFEIVKFGAEKSLFYWRKDQFVAREIYKFKKK